MQQFTYTLEIEEECRLLKGFTLKQIADSNRVSKSTVKSFAAAHGFKPIDKSGNAYIYSDELMAVVAQKYGEPANSAKLFNQAVSVAESNGIDELKKQVDQLSEFASWWPDFDDQKLVSAYVYRYILSSKVVRTDKESVRILQFFGGFSLNPSNEKLEQAVENGSFKFFVWRFSRLLNRPADDYAMISHWSKCSDNEKHSIVRNLDNALSKNYRGYREFSTGYDVQGAGVVTPANSADSSSASENSETGRCKTALLADEKSTEKGA